MKGLTHHLPDVVRPKKTVCFTVEVPDDPWYLRAWFGTFFELASARSWDNDPDHTALEVAKVWLEIALALKPGCSLSTSGTEVEDMPRIRVDPDNNCILQQECLPDQWVTLWDISSCIGANIAQPAGGGALPTDDVRCYNVVLDGNGQFLLPVPVDAGFRITVTDAEGATTDGAFLGSWRCADGSNYDFGNCGGTTTTDGGDPLPTDPHLMLIVNIGGTYYPLADGTFVVPAGVTGAQATFQVNDSILSDNSGSLKFRVCVANSASHISSLSLDTGFDTVVSTPWSSVIGKSYKITIGGRGVVGPGPTSYDAFYYDVSGSPVRATTGGSHCGFTNVLELTVDSHEFTPIPSFVSSDDYICYLAGTGAPFGFMYCDSDYSDNNGTLSILVEEQ